MLLLMCLSLLFALHHAVSQQTPVCVYYHNISQQQANTTLQVTVTMNTQAVSGTGLSTTIDLENISYINFTGTLYSFSTPVIFMERTVKMLNSTVSPPRIQLSTKLNHCNGSADSLVGVEFEEDLHNGLQAFWTASFVPGLSAPGLSVSGRSYLHYAPPSPLNPGNSVTVQFEAEPSGDQGTDLSEGITHFDAFLKFNTSTTSFGPVDLPVCLRTYYQWKISVFYRHGFTALTFFCALLLGFLLVALAVCIFLFICHRCNMSSVYPARNDDHHIKETSRLIVIDPKVALRKGFNVIKDHSIMKWNESIVLILSQKDKLHMFREIDNLDVLATIHVDTDLEQEQNDAAVQTSFLLLQGLRHNGDITRPTEDAAIAQFNAQLKDLDKKLEADYKKELEVICTDLSSKNKERLLELLQKHRAEKQKAVQATKELSDKERQGLLDLISRQQQMEQNELTFTLALEQNEEAEKLRKEFAIRKRMGIKELQQNMISDVISKGQLQMEQADWLMKEHKKQQEAVHRMYDEEISRQRMVLEEKLARRRALAQASETQEDDHKEELNLSAAHVVGFLMKGRKSSLLTDEQSEEWIEEMKAKALAIKNQMDTTNETQEKELHKKLSQVKMTRLGELIKKHEAEIQEFVKTNKSQQSEGPVDPVSYAEGLLKLRSQHRVELTNLENEMDADHAAQLLAIRDKEATIALDKLQEMERDTIQRLKGEGMSDKVLETLVKKYNEETQNLKRTHEKNRRNQEDKLKEELARRRREWISRREKERQEQEDLREHEAEVVEKLVNSQVSMSEVERDRIMKEHEKQMVLLENSLTLNKLRQQRALEERLNQRRAQQISKLQTQQQSEVNKHHKMAENNGEEDDEETHRVTLELMKKHAQQRIAVMQGLELNIDEELEQIRIEMTKERALALKSQEERLGAMITALQMEKAREMTQIEEQQKAINNLKANLMDDLNERGILSTPECEHILDVHRQESEAMNQRLENQRNKQENVLQQKLQERLKQREQLLLAQHQAEMKLIMEMPGSKFNAKVRRAMLIHKHVVEMEKFRNRMGREVSQSLAETRRQFEVLKLRKLQEQELSFVAGLVRVGCFQQNELMDVLHMLFPGKTEQDIQQVYDKITEGTTKPASDDMKSKSSIVEKIYQAQYVTPSLLNSTGSFRSLDGSQKNGKLSKKSSRLSMTYPGAEPIALRTTDQPRPGSGLGRGDMRRSNGSDSFYTNPAYSHEYMDHYNHQGRTQRITDDDSYRRDYDNDKNTDYIAVGAGMSEHKSAPVGRLAPLRELELSTTKKKKKGSLLKKHRLQQQQMQEDEDL